MSVCVWTRCQADESDFLRAKGTSEPALALLQTEPRITNATDITEHANRPSSITSALIRHLAIPARNVLILDKVVQGHEVYELGQQNAFSLTGECPHCHCLSVFHLVTSVHQSSNPQMPEISTLCAGMRCIGCEKYILGIVEKQSTGSMELIYKEHYPLGKPNDKVPTEIPKNIALDYTEAIRCRWIDAYNATAEMCRRALQASCIEQGSNPNLRLVDQIDWLSSEGKSRRP